MSDPDKIQEELRQKATELLGEQKVNIVIGYGRTADGGTTPTFVKTAEKVDELVWDNACFFNLATYLGREHIRKLFPAAIVVKGCDMRAVNMLVKENIFDRDQLVVIGVPCDGVGDPMAEKCVHCEVRKPEGVDELLAGEPEAAPAEGDKYDSISEFDDMSAEQLWEHWGAHFERCVRCYACRQACPMCYCKRCIAEKTQPTWIEFSPHLRGNFAWNAIRAFHLTGRCVGCGECERVCPANIPLSKINSKMAKVVEDQFQYVAGMDAETPTPFTTFDMGIDNDEGIL